MNLAASHRLTVDLERIPLDGVNDALDRLAAGNVRGRSVIDFAL